MSLTALTHCVSTTLIGYRCQLPGGGGGHSRPRPPPQNPTPDPHPRPPPQTPDPTPDPQLFSQTQSSLQKRSHRIKISNRRATQRCNVSAFFLCKICSLLARRRSSQPVQRVYWPENVIEWLGKWRPTCVMRHARGQKLQSFRL